MPLNSQEKLFLEEWLEVADLDLSAAQRMLDDSPAAYGYLVAFAFQQAVEKYAKAVLLAHEKIFPKSHDLPDLPDKLAFAVSFSAAEAEDADALAAYAVSTRYPPKTRVTVAEMHDASRIAHHFAAKLRPLVLPALA